MDQVGVDPRDWASLSDLAAPNVRRNHGPALTRANAATPDPSLPDGLACLPASPPPPPPPPAHRRHCRQRTHPHTRPTKTPPTPHHAHHKHSRTHARTPPRRHVTPAAERGSPAREGEGAGAGQAARTIRWRGTWIARPARGLRPWPPPTPVRSPRQRWASRGPFRPLPGPPGGALHHDIWEEEEKEERLSHFLASPLHRPRPPLSSSSSSSSSQRSPAAAARQSLGLAGSLQAQTSAAVGGHASWPPLLAWDRWQARLT